VANGKWRSLAARCVRDAEVGGSSPPFPTFSQVSDQGKQVFRAPPCASVCFFEREIAKCFANHASSPLDDGSLGRRRRPVDFADAGACLECPPLAKSDTFLAMGLFGLVGPRCPRCGKRGLRGRASKAIVDGVKRGLRVNPEWLWSECRKCGSKFKERHYGDGALIPVNDEEWAAHVVSART